MIAFLFLLLVVLNIADGVTTAKVLSQGGTELNPLLEPVMRAIGVVPALVLAKGILLGVFAAAWFALPPALLTGALVLADVIYLAVVLNNLDEVR